MKKFIIVFLMVLVITTMVFGCANNNQRQKTTHSQTPSTTASVPQKTNQALVLPETTVLVDGLVFPENPRWHDGKLWFADSHANNVMTVDIDGKTNVVAQLTDMPGGLGWDAEGRLLVVSMNDKRLLRLDPGSFTQVADLNNLASGPCNDMAVDALGRAYIGNFGLNTDLKKYKLGAAELIMVAPDGKAGVVAKNMIFPNGSVITPDGNTLIVAESLGSRLIAFDIESDGSLSNPRLWAKLDKGVYPDGICLDSAGAVWVANSNGNQVIRVLEGGVVTHRVITKSSHVYACALGGSDLRTLFIMAAESDDMNENRATSSGRIETIKVDTAGALAPGIPSAKSAVGLIVSGYIVDNGDTRPDSDTAYDGINTYVYQAAREEFHGDLEGTTTALHTVKHVVIDGSYTGFGEGTFTGTVNNKKGTFTFSYTAWGNFLGEVSGIGTYHIIINGGTEELQGIQGTITWISHFGDDNKLGNGLYDVGTYTGRINFEK
jgi:sugar lactone lactonase YvrE